MLDSARYPNIGLLDYVTNSTLPHIAASAGAPAAPPAGHKSHKNYLTVKSESWRRLENIYQIDSFDFAQQVDEWARTYIPNKPFEPNGATVSEKITLNVRRPDRPPRMLEVPVEDIHQLSAVIDSLPLRTAQRLYHILSPDSVEWRFRRSRVREVDQQIFDCFLWERYTQDKVSDTPVVVAYQPPWILSPADFEEFAKSTSFPPFVNPGHAYPSELQSRHRLWAKLWDTCVIHNTRWFIITSYNMWAFGVFSKGWCTGFISDIWHSDEHNPTLLACIAFWMASAMECDGTYQVPKVPEPVRFLKTDVVLPDPGSDIPMPADSESNWGGKSQDAATSARLTSMSACVSHLNIDYIPAPAEREKPVLVEFIRQWQQSIVSEVDLESNRILGGSRLPQEVFRPFQGEWLI